MGISTYLDTPGGDAQKTKDKEDAKELLEKEELRYHNARQVMLHYKWAHGSGVNPTFPSEQEINEHMQGFENDELIPVYGDGSLESPKRWWAAVGGYGIWVPQWNREGEEDPRGKEQRLCGPPLGQTGSSTRQEMLGWIMVLSMPIRSHYATDSAAMLGKAKQLMHFARKREEDIAKR